MIALTNVPVYSPGTAVLQGRTIDITDVIRRGLVSIFLIVVTYQAVKWGLSCRWGAGKSPSVYGLEHGKLHLQVPTAMWMNMGYWKDASTSTTMSEACRDLLKAVLVEAGFSKEMEDEDNTEGTRPRRCLVDLGFGCGDQSIYLMSDVPLSPSDRSWWDKQARRLIFSHYIGITKDASQAKYALARVEALRNHEKHTSPNIKQEASSNIALFCGDAARPASWTAQIHRTIQLSQEKTQDFWILALDTAYHFAPSRWQLIQYIHSTLEASFMAFDLCVSPTATFHQKLVLRVLTTVMGAPWLNFVTPAEYGRRLIQAGYQQDEIRIVDISENVFTPLADFLDEQDKKLATIGLGIGGFNVAKMMFGWWGRSGVVRGVIVVAKHEKSKVISTL